MTGLVYVFLLWQSIEYFLYILKSGFLFILPSKRQNVKTSVFSPVVIGWLPNHMYCYKVT